MSLPSTISNWLLRAYRRPLWFLLTLVLLPLALVVSITSHSSITLWRQQAFHQLRMTAQLAAEIIQETLGDTQLIERLLVAQPVFVEAVQDHDRKVLTQQLQEALSVMSRVDAAMVLSPEGTVIAAYPDSPSLVGQSLAQDERVHMMRNAGWRPFISPVYFIEQEPPRKVVGIATPILHSDRVIGMLYIQHRVEDVKSWLQRIRVEPEGFLYVVDHHQQLVVYPYQVLPGRPKVVADWPPVAAPLASKGTELSFRDRRNGQQWLAGIYPIGTIGWRVVAVQPERAVLRLLDRVLWSMGALVGFLAILLVAISLWWAQLQDASLRLLSQNTKMLRELQQRHLLDRGKSKGSRGGSSSG